MRGWKPVLVIKLALRNLFRNRRRTILSLSLIALGTAALFLFRGYNVDVITAVKDSAIERHGHFQIATEAYWEGGRYGYDYLISPELLAGVKEVLAEEPQVISYSTNLGLEGLIATEEKSMPVVAIGIQPGNPVPDVEVKEGRRLEQADLEAVLISPGLARALEIEVGDYLMVTARTVHGDFKSGNVKVAGISRPGEIEGTTVITPISFNQMMRETDRIGRIVVKLDDHGATEEVALRVQRALEGNDLAGLRVRTWEDLAWFHHLLALFLNSVFGFIGLVIFLLVLFSVLEALTMAFFERIREVGTVRAIGTRRHQVFGMFLIEGVLLGLFSGLLGVALGWGIGSLINVAGLTYILPIAGEKLPFRIALGLDVAWAPFLVALVATTISAIYPAYRAAKLEIASALRFV
ncbi:FtsX-like permease family protein [Dehalococcoidia bacterium]|nr:FtsX-like permease family protein [Dehalococcoidia bacterium]